MGQLVWLCRLLTAPGDPAKKVSWGRVPARIYFPECTHARLCIHLKGVMF